MRTHRRPTVHATMLAIVAIGFFHIARPLAVSAQSSATARVEAVVLAADAAWTAYRVTERVVRADAGSPAARHEESGTVAWRNEDPADPTVTVVTVAHLGS
jgi:hypothetical protein